MGIVITLSGAIGRRRSELAEKLADRLVWPRVKFSDYIKRRIAADGEDERDRMLQQSYGQKLVQNQLQEFVGGVLAMAPDWRDQGNLVVDGLRHVEVLLTLRRLIGTSTLVYVNVLTDPLRRDEGARARGILEQNLYRYDRALSEAQITRILPAYADIVVDGTLGFSINIDGIVAKIKQMQGQEQVAGTIGPN